MPRKKLVDINAMRENKKVAGPGQEFVFRLPTGQEVGRAKSLGEFVERIKAIPLQSVLYHANGGHFASWLEFMGENGAASRIKTVKGNGEDVRKALLSRI